MEEFQPDYDSWYRIVLGSARKNPQLAEQLRSILSDHAAGMGTSDALSAAFSAAPKSKRSLTERIARAQGQLHSLGYLRQRMAKTLS